MKKLFEVGENIFGGHPSKNGTHWTEGIAADKKKDFDAVFAMASSVLLKADGDSIADTQTQLSKAKLGNISGPPQHQQF